MRSLTLITLALAATGCSTFYEQDAVNGVTETVFDDRLPSSMESLFAQCAEPLRLDRTTTEIDLTGDCDASDVDGAEEQALFWAMAIAGPVDLGDGVPTPLYTGSQTLDGIPWPMQNCEVDIDYRVRLDRLDLHDLWADWQTHDGRAALRIDFDFDRWADAFEFKVDYAVDCPSAINEATLNGLFSVAIPSGWRQVELDGLDLDIWLELYDAGDAVAGALDVRVNVSDFDTDTYLSNLPGDLDAQLLSALGFDVASLEDLIEDELSGLLAGLPGEVAAVINDELPAGEIVCSVGLDGGDLLVVSDDPGRLQCLRWALRGL